MDLQLLKDYCETKPGAYPDFPFDEVTLAYRIADSGKIFLLCSIDKFDFINLKCEPEYAIELREKYPDSVLPGYHMSKKNWNSVYPNREISDSEIFKLIDLSYDLIVKSLPASKRP